MPLIFLLARLCKNLKMVENICSSVLRCWKIKLISGDGAQVQ